MFATSSVLPQKVRILTAEDIACMRNNTAKLRNNVVDEHRNREYGIYDRGDTVTNYCLSKRLPKETYDDPSKKNFDGSQLTVHRYGLRCVGGVGKSTIRVLPQQEQGWSEHMGSMSNGYFNRRENARLH